MSLMFETERLMVRRWTLQDTEAFFALFADPDMYRFMPGKPLESLEASSVALQRMLDRMSQWEGMGSFAALDRTTGAIIGNALLRPLEDGPRIEVGYHVIKAHWGNGYATEIARGAVRYGFEDLGLEEIYGVVVPANIASRRVLEKAGLTRIGPGHVYGLECDVMRIERASMGHIVSSG
jgi:ribosomal-protein-alanine N-acetyltransferase